MRFSRVRVSGPLHQWISSFLLGRQQSVIIQGLSSRPERVTSGVPQRTVLGPPLLLMYINDLCDCRKSNVRPVATQSDCESLQCDLKQLERWEKKWMMSFKPDKCLILHFTRRKANKIEYSYKLSSHYLKVVNHHKYLGVTLSTDMNWNTHIDNITSKANSMLGFVQCNLSTCRQCPPQG